MPFQKTLIYNKAHCPPIGDILSIAKSGDCIINVTDYLEKVCFVISTPYSANELYRVVIDIIIKYPFSEFPFKQDTSDFDYECGEPVYRPDELN